MSKNGSYSFCNSELMYNIYYKMHMTNVTTFT